MADKWIPQEIEPRWQKKWEADELYRSKIDPAKPKEFCMTMYPYPSGDLHMGHWFAISPSDVRARWMRMRGYNVLFPMGFDAFGLPAENAAIKRGIHPRQWTYANIERMRKQLRSMGAMFDWERECVTCDPEYYRWTEWFSASCTTPAWPTRRWPRLISVPTAIRPWPASKCGARTATASAAARRSSRRI